VVVAADANFGPKSASQADGLGRLAGDH